jgi:hypothetical protein
MSWCRAHSGTCDQILLPVGRLLSESYVVSVGRPLWWQDGSAVCSAITQWSESRRTRNHTLLSHLRPPQLGGPGSRIYIPQEQGGPFIPPGSTSSRYIAPHGPHRTRLSNCYVSFCFRGNVFTELFPSKGRHTVFCSHSCYFAMGLHVTLLERDESNDHSPYKHPAL